MLQAVELLFHRGIFCLHSGQRLIWNKADFVSDVAQALVCVILPVEQAILAARGHHAVGFVGALGHQVVNQCPDVPVLAVQDEGTLPLEFPRRVHTGDKALYRRLLIAGGAVELSRSVEARDLFRFQRRIKLRRVDAVVFDGIGRAGHLRVFQPRHRVQHLQLYLLRHGRGEALDIEFLGIQAHRLDEQLMARLVREGHDLCLDAWAVARPNALDDPGIDRTAVQIPSDDLMGLRACPGQVADHAVLRDRFGRKREGLRFRISGLEFHFCKVRRPAEHPRRRAGLEPAHRKPERTQPFRQRHSRGEAVGSGRAQQLADNRPSVEIGPRGHDDSPAAKRRPGRGHHTADRAV